MNPAVPSLAVDNPEIDEVLDLATGEILSLWQTIGEDYEKALQLRMALKEGIAENKPLYACPLCVVPVHLVSLTQERRFYFRHEIEDGRCPAKTKGSLSERQILALKYDGARESAAHKRMKEIIAESLRHDPSFSEIAIEPIWKGMKRNDRRQPDVRAIWNGIPVAFEVQLSTTFLRVIAERRAFYLREGGLLVWVFKSFDMGNARLTQDDIFYNNNRNAFLASEDTLKASKNAKAFMLECVWSEPSIDDGQMFWSQQKQLVCFADLTVERECQRVFLFDADGAKERCLAQNEADTLRSDFSRFWLAYTNGEIDNTGWLTLRERFKERGLSLPHYPTEVNGLRALLDTLYTAKKGKPIGWRYADLVKVAHHVEDRHKGFLWPFKLMLKAHGRGPQILALDTTKKWRDKVKRYTTAWANLGDTLYQPDRRFDDLVVFLFPEIATELTQDPY